VAGEDVQAELRDALLERGPEMLDLVLALTPLKLAWVPGYADYYPEAPGGLASGRSIEPVPFNGSDDRPGHDVRLHRALDLTPDAT
jgi:3-oxosteroid 1-dehydrogenase